MTVPSRAREFGFDFEILGEKKSPTDFSAGLGDTRERIRFPHLR